jgi:hypothetical protein
MLYPFFIPNLVDLCWRPLQGNLGESVLEICLMLNLI